MNALHVLKSELPLSYFTDGVSAPVAVTKTILPFENTAADMEVYAKECDYQHSENYFDNLVSEFEGTSKIQYKFHYEGE